MIRSARSTPPHGFPALEVLRTADWLDPARARAYAMMLCGLQLIGFSVWLALAAAQGGLDLAGKPAGADFPSFWAASRLALDHLPDAAYDPSVHGAVQRGLFHGAPAPYSAFFYPPPYLIACLPLALLPYGGALAAWLSVTVTAMLAALRTLIEDRWAMLALATYPAVFSNIGHGQNAFLTTALLAAGLLGADRRPLISGVLIGLMACKPHLAVTVPVALVVAGRWQTIVTAAVTATVLCCGSLVLFGWDTWSAFLQNSPLATATLEQGLVGDAKMQSAFAGLRLAGAPLWGAWTGQALVSLSALGILVIGIRRTRDAVAQASLTICAGLLVTPFLLDYDLMLAAVPLLWLLQQGRRTGFLPWEKVVMLAAFLLPLVSRLVGQALHLPVATTTIAALTACVLRRVTADTADGVVQLR
jgi:alpha-1,2-mannosyltransferase